MPAHDHTDDGAHPTGGNGSRRGGYFPLAPGLLHDPRLDDLTWRQRYVFIVLLSNAWRGPDRNGTHAEGQVIRPLPEIAASLGIRIDHLRDDIARMVRLGLLASRGGTPVVADFGRWHRWAGTPVDTPAGEPRGANRVPQDGESAPQDGEYAPQDGEYAPQDGEYAPQNGESVPQNGESVPQNGESVPQNGVTVPQNGVTVPQNGVDSPQNRVTEVPPAQVYHGLAASVRRLSDVSSETQSDETSSSDVTVAADAATVTRTADDDGVPRVSDHPDVDVDGNGDGDVNGGPVNDDPGCHPVPGITSGQDGGMRRGPPAASPEAVAGDAHAGRVEEELVRAGLNPAQARRYRSVVPPEEAIEMIGIFTRYYTDRGNPGAIVPCVVSALSRGGEHVRSVIRGGRANPGYRRVTPGTATTSGGPSRSVTAGELGDSREANRRRLEEARITGAIRGW